MKTNVIKENTLYEVNSSCYNSSATLKITKGMLKEAELGHVFYAQRENACGRAVSEEELKVVYKDVSGVACVLSSSGTSDSPNPEYCEGDDELIWFQFLD